MKALPIAIFVIAVLFALMEWHHSRVHETALQNADARLRSIQVPGEHPVPQVAIKKIEPGTLKIGKIGSHVLVIGGKAPPPSAGSPSSTVPSVNDQVAAAKREQAEENKTVQASHDTMMNMRVILTVLFVPACFFIITAKQRFDGKDRGFAYTSLGAILTFWLHS